MIETNNIITKKLTFSIKKKCLLEDNMFHANRFSNSSELKQINLNLESFISLKENNIFSSNNKTTTTPLINKEIININKEDNENNSTNNDYLELKKNNNNNLEKSKLILSRLDSFDYLNNETNGKKQFKEEIGFCNKCRKLISLRYTNCSSCSKNFCKQHREAHLCEANINYSNKAKIIDGKNAFMKRLKQNKIKAGVI